MRSAGRPGNAPPSVNEFSDRKVGDARVPFYSKNSEPREKRTKPTAVDLKNLFDTESNV